MYSTRKHGITQHIDFMLIDILSLLMSFMIAYDAYNKQFAFPWSNNAYLVLTIYLVVADIIVLIFSSGFNRVFNRGYFIEFEKTFVNGIFVFAIITVSLFVFKVSAVYSRIITFSTFIIYIFLCYLFRVAYKLFYTKFIVPTSGDTVIVITTSDKLRSVENRIKNNGFIGYNIKGIAVIDVDDISSCVTATDKIVDVVAGKNNYIEYIRLNWCDQVLLVLPISDDTAKISNKLIEMGMPVHLSLESLKDINVGVSSELGKMGDVNVISMFERTYGVGELFIKRAMDIIGSIFGILIMLIAVIFVGPIIKISSPGPIFFSQERVGRNGKRFKMLKIRSMVVDAEARKNDLQSENIMSDGMMFKVDFDPRIIGNRIGADGKKKTGIGHFIRKTSIDELPQFINVLKGDMSLVGTRPPTVDEWTKYEDHHRARLAMRPGITGLWQVSGRNKITNFEEIVGLDKEYINNWNIGLDIKILLKTILVVIMGDGSM